MYIRFIYIRLYKVYMGVFKVYIRCIEDIYKLYMRFYKVYMGLCTAAVFIYT